MYSFFFFKLVICTFVIPDVVIYDHFCVCLLLFSQEEMENKAMYLSTYEERENGSMYEEAYDGHNLSKLNLCDEGKGSSTAGSREH